MVKVCHMTSVHPSEDVRIFVKECVSLAEAGYEVTLIERGESYDKNGVHIKGIGMPRGGRLNRMLSFGRKAYEAALQVDAELYHFHDPELWPYGLKLKRKGKKVIFDSHECYPEQLKLKPYLPAWITVPMAWLYSIFENHAVGKIDGVVYAGTGLGMPPFKGHCKNLTYIDNVSLLSEFYDHYMPNLPKKERQICYVGGLTETRGITTLIKAAYQAKVRLALAGPFIPEHYEDEVRAMPEFSCVDYRGTLDRNQVRELIGESQVGMAIFLDDGQYLKMDNLPTKAHEYMAMGIPTVLSSCEFNENAVKQYHFGMCSKPGDVDDVAKTITYLMDHPKEREEMGRNGRIAVRDKFNWDVEKKKLFAMYEEILKK